MHDDALVPGGWVLLSYRMPRVPSSPRVAVWRRLQALGVAQLGDGLVALPADARTREHFDWTAAEILENGGTATVWLAKPASPARERQVAAAMADERRAEYCALGEEARVASTLVGPARARAARRLRSQLRKVARRDYFPPVERETAQGAIADLLTAHDAATGDLMPRPAGDRQHT